MIKSVETNKEIYYYKDNNSKKIKEMLINIITNNLEFNNRDLNKLVKKLDSKDVYSVINHAISKDINSDITKMLGNKITNQEYLYNILEKTDNTNINSSLIKYLSYKVKDQENIFKLIELFDKIDINSNALKTLISNLEKENYIFILIYKYNKEHLNSNLLDILVKKVKNKNQRVELKNKINTDRYYLKQHGKITINARKDNKEIYRKGEEILTIKNSNDTRILEVDLKFVNLCQYYNDKNFGKHIKFVCGNSSLSNIRIEKDFDLRYYSKDNLLQEICKSHNRWVEQQIKFKNNKSKIKIKKLEIKIK